MLLPTITIRQPWVWLILQQQWLEARKDIENRSWNLPARYLDTPVLVHTSAKPNLNCQVCVGEMYARGLARVSVEPHKDEANIGLSGHIVGVVRFSLSVYNPTFDMDESAQDLIKTESPWCDRDSKYWWKIEKAKPITPVSAKGRLSFWKFDYPHPEELEGF